MTFLPAYILLSILVLMAFMRPKSISIHFILLLAIFLFFAFSYDNGDRLAYEYEFETIHSSTPSSYEILYIALMKFGALFCDTFQQYRCFQSILVLFIIDYVITRYSKAPNVVLACYLIFSALFDATLMRHIVAMSVSLYGVFILLKAHSFRDYIFVALVFIACGLLHSSYWLLLAFIPLRLLLKAHPIITIITVVIGYIIAIQYQSTIFYLFGLFIIREGVIDKYMTGEYANSTGALYDFVKYIFIISPCFLHIFYKKKLEPSIISNNDKQWRVSLLQDNIVIVNLMFSIILIPQFFAVNYFRLYRVLIVINYIYMSNLYYLSSKKRNHIISLVMLAYSFTLLLLLLFFESENTLTDVWNMHFETNSVFKWISI